MNQPWIYMYSPSRSPLPHDPAIPLLGIHTEETRSERDTCTPMFIATLFIIARTRKQPRCPSADEWIRKRWYIYTMDYYSAIKKNSFESVLMRWMKLEPILLFSSIYLQLITEGGFLLSPCYSLELCIQMGISFLFSFAFHFSSFHSYL